MRTPFGHTARRHEVATQEESGKEDRVIVQVDAQDHFVFR